MPRYVFLIKHVCKDIETVFSILSGSFFFIICQCCDVLHNVSDLSEHLLNVVCAGYERAEFLEGSVKQAQQSESQVLALQNSLTQVDSVLTARLECDLTADDLPHDFKVWSQISLFSITKKKHV